VPIPEPTLPEPDVLVPLPEVVVAPPEQPLEVTPRTVPTPPGQRVVQPESTSIIPLRPGLSEGPTDDLYGTPEEEQQAVWNVRSLKLRRALGI
jgi:hypothetical protein